MRLLRSTLPQTFIAHIAHRWLFAGIVLLIAGCSNGNNTDHRSGQFIDSPVQGLGYIATGGDGSSFTDNQRSGTTDDEGEFGYVQGDFISFFLGGIELGSSLAERFLTPNDLFPGGGTGPTNLARFLLTLDADGDPSNGIQISPAVQALARDLSAGPADFSVSTDAFTSSPLADFARNANGPPARTLVSAAEADAHVACSEQDIRDGDFDNDSCSEPPPAEPDADDDDVPDASDLCPDTPSGEIANAQGCSPSQLDDDNDGVSNASDICPDTAANAETDGNGCSAAQRDNDQDGVSDADDLCPDTPSGETPNADGCSPSQLDDDNDGVSNADDACPDTAEGVEVSANGCPVIPPDMDADGDGVNDASDLCPDTPSGEIADAQGCSASQRDSDADGVNDNLDLCPATPDGEAVNGDGCSASQLDDDDDGVTNDLDSCPGTAAMAVVDANGCSDAQRDDDNDTVANGDDLCPATPAGLSVDAGGCSAQHCHATASAALSQCHATVAARVGACYFSSGSQCADDDSNIVNALAGMRNAVAEACATDSSVQGAGYGAMRTTAGLQGQLQDACTGEPQSMASRALGGPHAKLLQNHAANPAATNCLLSAYGEAASIVQATYDDYAACVLDSGCDGSQLAANSAARELTSQATLTAACSSPSMEEVMGSTPEIFVQRASAQGRCMVAEGHGDTSNVALDCGPDNVLFSAATILEDNAAGAPIADVDAIQPGQATYIELDSDAWGTICGDGSPYAFVLRLAPEGQPPEKVLLHQEGGGVCLGGTADCTTRPQSLFEARDNGGHNLQSGYFSTDPKNPLRNWSMLFQPYCNQDLHIGGGGIEPGGRPENDGQLRRFGAINVRASTRFFRDLIWRMKRDSTTEGYLPSQPRAIFSGTSAGGYGVQYNLHYPLDELRWENTLGNAHVAFVQGGGSTDVGLLFSTVGNTWATRPFQPPYCLEDECSLTRVNHPAHAERLGATQFQLLLQTTPQHDTTQEPTQGYPGPVAPPVPVPGLEAKDWINLLRQNYCLLKGTPNLYFHMGANTVGTHDFLNVNSVLDHRQQRTQELLVNGHTQLQWLAGIAETEGQAIDRVEDGTTIFDVDPFPCDLTPVGFDGDSDGDGILNIDDICPGTPDTASVALNGCPISGSDVDLDGIRDADDLDRCPATPTTELADEFGCGPSQKDFDADGHLDSLDNCPYHDNPGQEDTNGDGEGDACDPDIDEDGFPNDEDNCPADANPDQLDTNLDGIGDACTNPPSARPSAFSACYQPELTTAPVQPLHECSWNHHAHALQRQLDDTTPMVESLWLASHNSYNYPQPEQQSSIDPNQLIDIPTQLDLEMRGVEIDIHWIESPRCSGNLQPLACHSTPDHQFCSGTEPQASIHFTAINNWLNDNPGEIVQVDLESSFSVNRPAPPCPPGSAAPAGGNPFLIVRDQMARIFGSKIYTPADSGESQLPLGVTRADIRAAGKQVVITGNNNAAWADIVHGLNNRSQHVYNDASVTYPGCGWFTPSEYRTRWTRMWEDSTNVGTVFVPEAEPIGDADLIEMIRCGLNEPSIDKFQSSDSRLAAAIWSWAEGEPIPNDEANCARHNAAGRLVSADCSTSLPYACLNTATQTWSLTPGSGSFAGGETACTALANGSVFAVPTTGYFNQLLIGAKGGTSDVWVNYAEDAVTEGIWIPSP